MKKISRMIFLLILIIILNLSCITTNEAGRTQLMLTSESQENQMGTDYYKQVLDNSKISKNEKWIKLINRVGERLSKATGKEFDWEYHVIESSQVNAWALPGGKIAFYEGIMKVFDDEAEIAVVMGHEIGHVVLRHGGERMSQGMLVNVVGAVLETFTPEVKYKELYMGAFAGITTFGVVLPYSRLHEYEADNYGIMLMAKAGYDPKSAVSFWEKMSKLSQGSKPPEFISTHPSDENRIQKMKELMSKALDKYDISSTKYGLGDKVN